MNALVKRLYAKPAYSKLFEWSKLIAISGSMQILVQLFSFVSGIIIIRLLPTKEYALYTLSNVMLGTISVLADGGIIDGVMSQGGKAWKDRTWLGSVLITGLDLRKKFAIASLCIAVPILVYLLIHHGASWQVTILLVLAIIPSFFIELSGKILEVAPKLWQDTLPLQKNQVALYAARFVILCLFLFALPFSFVAILAVTMPQLWYNFKLRKISAVYADRNQAPDPVKRKAILKIVKRTMPGAVYYCFYGQITTWLISIFGSTENLAKVGALSRLVMVLNVFTAICSILIVPRFARLANNRRLLTTRFLQTEFCLFAVSIVITISVMLFSDKLLFLLGNNYSGLSMEIVIIAGSSCLGMMMGVTYAISLARGWVIHPAVSIIGNIATQLILLSIFDLSKVQNVLWYSVITNLVAFLLLFVYYLLRVLKTPKNFT